MRAATSLGNPLCRKAYVVRASLLGAFACAQELWNGHQRRRGESGLAGHSRLRREQSQGLIEVAEIVLHQEFNSAQGLRVAANKKTAVRGTAGREEGKDEGGSLCKTCGALVCARKSVAVLWLLVCAHWWLRAAKSLGSSFREGSE